MGHDADVRAGPGVEIERKFVLPEIPAKASGAPSDRIDQGYLAVCDEVEVRIRRIGERTVLTVKRGAGERRLEEEVDIPRAGFEALWPLTEGRRVEKERFRLGGGGNGVELDVYRGALDGLVVAEIEFDSDEASEKFDPPAWLGREVTGDERFANQRLALHGRPGSEGGR
jgi:adenylate cyclase